jgi:hypothetical protein
LGASQRFCQNATLAKLYQTLRRYADSFACLILLDTRGADNATITTRRPLARDIGHRARVYEYNLLLLAADTADITSVIVTSRTITPTIVTCFAALF